MSETQAQSKSPDTSSREDIIRTQLYEEKPLQPNKWRYRFALPFMAILGFLFVAALGVYLPDSWMYFIRDLIRPTTTLLAAAYGIPWMLFWIGGKVEESDRMKLLSRVFGYLFAMVAVGGVFAYFITIYAPSEISTNIWYNPFFIQLVAWLIFLDIIFGLFLTMEQFPVGWRKLFERFGYKPTPVSREDRIWHKLRYEISYPFWLKRQAAKRPDKPTKTTLDALEVEAKTDSVREAFLSLQSDILSEVASDADEDEPPAELEAE